MTEHDDAQERRILQLEAGWAETLADVRQLPATMYIVGQPGPQHVAARVTLPDGSVVRGTARLSIPEDQ